VLDYYGFAKAGYYYVRRAYAPTLASFKALADGDIELWVTNDNLCEVADDATVRLRTFGGETAWEENIRVRIAANGSQSIRRWERDELAGGRPDHYLSVRSAEGHYPPNRHFFAAIKDLRRAPARPEASVTPGEGRELRVHLRALEYAYFVHVITPDETARFSDNYFDLEPGESRTIVVRSQEGTLTPEMVTVRWR
jgi:beta-mannosidase